MDLSILTEFISNVGFPIFACCYLAYSNDKQNKVLDDFISTLKGIDVRLQHLEKKD